MNSCVKGKRGEREAAAMVRRLFGTEAKRAQQHAGAAGDADLSPDSLPGFHLEVKYYGKIAAFAQLVGLTKLLAIAPAIRGIRALSFLEQATADATDGVTPIVLLRQNGTKRFAVMIWSEDFAALCVRADHADKQSVSTT